MLEPEHHPAPARPGRRPVPRSAPAARTERSMKPTSSVVAPDARAAKTPRAMDAQARQHPGRPCPSMAVNASGRVAEQTPLPPWPTVLPRRRPLPSPRMALTKDARLVIRQALPIGPCPRVGLTSLVKEDAVTLPEAAPIKDRYGTGAPPSTVREDRPVPRAVPVMLSTGHPTNACRSAACAVRPVTGQLTP